MLFFFSYARADRDVYLERFFSDLTNRVASLAATSREDVCFLDLIEIDIGDKWQPKLAKALAESAVLVSIYSNIYFTRPYCGKEFQVFRQRRTQSSDFSGILPIIWPSEEWLKRSSLPPRALRSIQWRVGSLPELYFERGMRLLSTNRRGAYTDTVERLAERIVERANNDPTPPLAEPPQLDEIMDAFCEASPQVATGPDLVSAVFVTANESAEQWHPFADSDRNAREMVDCLVGEGFRVTSPSTSLGIQQSIENARDNRSILLLVVEPHAAAGMGVRKELSGLLAESSQDVHVFLLVDSAGGQAFAGHDFLRPRGPGLSLQPPVTEVYSEKAFRNQLIRRMSAARGDRVAAQVAGIEGKRPLPLVVGPGGRA